MKKPKTVKIEVQSVSDQLADEIQTISDAMQILNNGRLSERTLKLLLRDATGLNLGQIESVLKALPNLAKWYLK